MMSISRKTRISKMSTVVLFGVLSFNTIPLAQAENRTLFNLERERSAFMDAVKSEQLSPTDRERKVRLSQRRLMDMERMVVRDDRLLGSKDPLVQRAFNNYESTFLVHASVEANLHIVDFWLQQMRLDSENILNSHVGRR